MADELMRVQKYLSECGVASRRKAEELISQGKVKVNGRTVTTGDKLNAKTDTVTVSGKKVTRGSKKVYILLHKPRGFVTTMSDEMGRKCVAELVGDINERVYPIGRLDRESEGLLLMTNDGEFANLLMHPAHHVPKVYRVTVRPGVSDGQIAEIESGMELDGRKTAPARVKILEKQEGRVVLEIVLYEGRNRQIRRMCEALQLDVARLKRTAIGTVKLGMLPAGKWRELTQNEVDSLERQAKSGAAAKTE